MYTRTVLSRPLQGETVRQKSRPCAFLLVLLSSAGAPIVACAQLTQVSLEATSFTTAQITLGAVTSQSEMVSATGTLEIAAPPAGSGSVLVRNVRITVPQVVLSVPFPVTVGTMQLQTLPGEVATLSGASGGALETLFFGPGPACTIVGQVSYSAAGPTCLSIAQSGGPCAGTFPLAAVGQRPSMIAQGSIAPSPGARAVQLVFRVSTPLSAGGDAWSRLAIDVTVRATIPEQTTCIADFGSPPGVDVQDLFTFLNAWFASDPRADLGGDGINVTDIFDFLNAWFQGCP